MVRKCQRRLGWIRFYFSIDSHKTNIKEISVRRRMISKWHWVSNSSTAAAHTGIPMFMFFVKREPIWPLLPHDCWWTSGFCCVQCQKDTVSSVDGSYLWVVLSLAYLAIITAAAPSQIPLAEPAVTTPFCTRFLLNRLSARSRLPKLSSTSIL